MTQWYYRDTTGTAIGPLAESELHAAVRQTGDPATLVAQDTPTHWFPYQKIFPERVRPVKAPEPVPAPTPPPNPTTTTRQAERGDEAGNDVKFRPPGVVYVLLGFAGIAFFFAVANIVIALSGDERVFNSGIVLLQGGACLTAAVLWFALAEVVRYVARTAWAAERIMARLGSREK